MLERSVLYVKVQSAHLAVKADLAPATRNLAMNALILQVFIMAVIL